MLESLKEKQIQNAFYNGLRPSKLILDRTGSKLFNAKFGIYSEVGVSVFNFLRDNDYDYEEEIKNNNIEFEY